MMVKRQNVYGIILGIVAALLLACSGLADLPRDKGDRIRLNEISIEYLDGALESAETRLNVYLKEYPEDDLAWTILGNVYDDLSRPEDARRCYEQSLALNPQRMEALTGLGILHRQESNYDLAMEYYGRAVKVDPTYAPAYSSMAVIALKRKQDVKALEYARRGYELDPEDPAIVANLAVACHYNNEFEKRDKYTNEAEQKGYGKIARLKEIYRGEYTIRD